MTDNGTNEIENFIIRLQNRLLELKNLENISRESRQAVTLDQSRVGRLSRMDAMQAQQIAAETDRRRQIEMSRIKSALQRIENDDFGYCIKCDEEISPKRLNNDPSVLTCINCAKGHT